MPWRPALNQLRDALAELYPDVADARVVAASALLSLSAIVLQGKARNVWQSILEEAEKQRLVEAVIDIASGDYPKDPALSAAVAAYRQSLAAAQSPAPAATPGAIADPLLLDLGAGVALRLARVPAGHFMMGSDLAADPWAVLDWERPQHQVWLPDYLIARTPVTVAQYRAFVQATGYQIGYTENIHGPDDLPVANATWAEALAFCDWASQVSGRQVRLPSEAEWEKAARWDEAAQHARIYPWGDRWDSRRCNSQERGPGRATPVGQYSPRGDSPCGCADMAGNVWEWTRSLWGQDLARPDYLYPYKPGRDREDIHAADDVLRVVRGGSFSTSKELVRCAFRFRPYPPGRECYFGFRVVVVPASL